MPAQGVNSSPWRTSHGFSIAIGKQTQNPLIMRGATFTILFILTVQFAFAQKDSIKTHTTDEVTVIAIRAGANDPTTFQNISKEDIQKNNLGQDFPYMLDLTPSLVTTSNSGNGIGYTGMRIRGSDATRINVTVNGVPMNEPDDQSVYWVDMPDIASSVENVQIQRGVGTSTNGGGAFGASVNIKTDAFSPTPFCELSTSAGSFDTRKHTLKVASGLIKNTFFIEARGSYIVSNGYVDQGWSHLWSYYAAAGFVKNKTMLKFVHYNGYETTYQTWYGVLQDSLATNRRFNIAGTDNLQRWPPWSNETDNYGKQYYQLILNQGISNRWNFNAVGFITTGGGYYEEYVVNDLLSNYLVYNAPFTSADVIRHLWLKNIYAGGVFSLAYDNKKNLNITWGGMGANFAGHYFGDLVWVRGFTNFNPNAPFYFSTGGKNDINTYVKANYSPIEILSLFADLQYRYAQFSAYGDDEEFREFNVHKSWNFFNPKAGLSVRLRDKGRLYASYAMAHREPAHDDIIENLTTTPVKPETLNDVEIGVDITKNMVKGDKVWVNFPFHLNGYMMYYINQLILTGQLNDVGNPIRVNAPQSYRTGLELLAEINFHNPSSFNKLFGIRYSVSYNLSKLINYTEVVPAYDVNYNPVPAYNQINFYKNPDIAYSPRWMGFIELNSTVWKRLELAWSFKFVDKQYLDNTESSDRMIPGFWYSNIRISYPIRISKKAEIKLTLMLNNIFNKLYVTDGSTYRERYLNPDGTVTPTASYNYYYPQSGFNCLGGFVLKF
jgi:iron complex outermembrane receptor protein